MRKYWVIFTVALSERLVYRTDFFLSTFLRFIPIITTILLWDAIYKGAERETIGDLTYGQIVGYYLLVMVSRAFGSMPGLASGIARDIRDGELRKYLLQPIDYLGYLITLRAAHKLIYFVMAATPYAIVFYMCQQYMPGWPSPVQLGWIVVTLVLAFMIGYAVNSLVGLVGFWFLEIGSLLSLLMSAQYFLSGHMFPLSLLPDWIRGLVYALPFAYETYFPTLILLQKVDNAGAARIVGVQLAWVIALLLIGRLVWRQGLKRYAAFGG
ncbi:MAG: ABC transporter permease [Phycisphaerae bacterium]